MRVSLFAGCPLAIAILLAGCSSNNGNSGDAAVDAAVSDSQTSTQDVSPGDAFTPTTSCQGKPNFTLCATTPKPSLWYQICIDEQCVTPSLCGTARCNAVGPHYKLPPDVGNQDLTRAEPVSGEAIVTDNVTGLIWQGCAAGTKGSKCESGAASTLTWQNALNYCNKLSWGGMDHWYLPDEYELQTLADYHQLDPNDSTDMAFNKTFFPNLPNDWFWTSSTYTDDQTEKTYLYTGVAYIDFGGQSSLSNVLCVHRGTEAEAPLKRFTRKEPKTGEPAVVDEVTGLTWQGCAVGTSGSDCTGSAQSMDWSTATSTCASLNWAGQTGWRLPNVKELRSIVDNRATRPSIDTTVFRDDSPLKFWSSTTHTTDKVWYVGFTYGNVNRTDKVSSHYTRCVRTGKL